MSRAWPASAASPTVLCVFEFGFMGGSMGSVVGEKLTRVDRAAIAKRAAA